jgi:hypothetical protein
LAQIPGLSMLQALETLRMRWATKIWIRPCCISSIMRETRRRTRSLR